MSEKLELELHNRAQALAIIKSQLYPFLANVLQSGNKFVLTVKLMKRSDAQNRLLHACLSEISKQIEWAGQKRDIETWKRLLTAAWLRARGEHVEMLPAIDGHGVDIVFRRTSQLTKAECSELSEFVFAWAAEHGVKVKEFGDIDD